MGATRAIQTLRQAGVPFTAHEYRYEDRGGTAVAARELGLDEHAIVKTLVLEDDDGRPLLMLMHGDREVSTKQLARALGLRSLSPAPPGHAERHTGYLVGGISPFGTRAALRICAERSLLGLERLYVNGGRRGLLVGLVATDLFRVLQPTLVDAAQAVDA
jgi:Cys-tRNA(Pro) deacylase